VESSTKSKPLDGDRSARYAPSVQAFVRSGGGAYLKLVEQRLQGRVTLIFEKAIAVSFQHDRARQTAAEIKRRFEICCSIFESLRADLQWGIDRIEDHLPAYLRCELDGIEWKPDERTVWTPQDGG